ncbi:MAG TPA: hypothetical protein VJB98_01345 [Candidatus Paceibacterota bacterium]
MEGISLKVIFLIVHILGVVMGAGAAFVTDAVFMGALKKRMFSKSDVDYISLASHLVWIGVIVIIVSGIALFALDPVKYLSSSKFMTKMIVVLVLVLNGAFFHFHHLKRLRAVADEPLISQSPFWNGAGTLFASGAISMVSWVGAVVLGVLKSLPFSLPVLTTVYFIVLAVAIGTALLVKDAKMKEGSLS